MDEDIAPTHFLQENSIDAESGDTIEIVDGGRLLFDGTIVSVHMNEVGFQIVQAVITSVSSSGGSVIGRVMWEIGRIKNGLNEYEWAEVKRRIGEERC